MLKINNMFNYSPLGEVRKLAGRLLVECMHGHSVNQDFFCELIDLEPLYGRVILNQELPELIKQKLQTNPSYLSTIQNLSDPQDRSFWSFPEYNDRVGSVSNASLDQTTGFKDSVSKYLNFPDS